MKDWKFKVIKPEHEFNDILYFESEDEARVSTLFTDYKVSAVTSEDTAKLKKIYIASPLFTDNEKKRINKVVQYLRKRGHEVISPMEFTVPNAWDLSNRDWAKAVYDHDMEALESADLVICIYDGLFSDSGTAWEVGYACAKGKPVLALVTDPTTKQSLMVINGVSVVADYKQFADLFLKYFNGVDIDTLNKMFNCTNDQS